jgi:uncharacterized Ntn-hydrolase superfamily protein
VTLSIIAADGAGALGMAVTSSSPAVGARCVHLRTGIGGAASQNVTDPRLGRLLLDQLAGGASPEQALRTMREQPYAEYRQLAVLDQHGRTAAHSGARSLGIHHHVARPGVVAAGNMLAGSDVVDAAVAGFGTSAGELETRLLAGLVAGLAAGGEAGPVRSAALAVVRDQDWRVTDLRVDWHDEPVAELARLLAVWLPQRDDYVTRALNPVISPAYGVPGDQ